MSHTPSPKRLSELQDLIHAMHEGTITPEEAARLEAWVCRDAAARRVYVRYMNLYAGLRWRKMQGPQPDQPAKAGKRQSAESPVLGFLGGVFQAGADFLSRSFVLSLLLAIGLPGIILLILVIDLSRQPLAPAPEPAVVAYVTCARQCVWGPDCSDMERGARLVTGRQLQLQQGLAEITFADGAKVILEGPATFRVRNGGGAFLDTGSLTAVVPPTAHGFTVQTPLANIVDLGTEFGVCVTPDGTAETHVFLGEVEVGTKRFDHDTPGAYAKYEAGQAARIRRVGSGQAVQAEPIASAPDRFVRRIAPETTRGLPEPKVIFSHYGDRDPATEGWRPSTERGMDKLTTKPINDGGIAAWSIVDDSKTHVASYTIKAPEGLTPEVLARARTHGWVLRARVKALAQESFPGGSCLCSFWGPDRDWTMRPIAYPDGTQSLYLIGDGSPVGNVTIPIANSRDRYIDYEIRYHPKTNDADVYVDGKLVATGYHHPHRSVNSLQFGVFANTICDMRVALVEWGILEP